MGLGERSQSAHITIIPDYRLYPKTVKAHMSDEVRGLASQIEQVAKESDDKFKLLDSKLDAIIQALALASSDGVDAATTIIHPPTPDDEGDSEDGDVGLGLDAIDVGGAPHDAATGSVTAAPAATVTTGDVDEGYSIDLLQLDQIQSTAHDSDHSDDDAEIS